jgi:hypothetical protein
MVRNKHVALGFRVAALLLVLLGLMAHLGLLEGRFRAGALMYYTVQSNILAVVLFLVLVRSSIRVISTKEESGTRGTLALFEMVCVIDLLLTFIVYWTLLAPEDIAAGNASVLWKFDNLTVHFFTPMLCLLDYFLFAVPTLSRLRDLFYALIFPLLYAMYSSVAGLCGYTYSILSDGRPKRFPYFFLDYDRIGVKALLYIAMVAAMLLAIGYAVHLLQRRILLPSISRSYRKV